MHVQQHVLFCLLPYFLMRLCNGLEMDLGTTATWKVKSSTQDLEVSNIQRQLYFPQKEQRQSGIMGLLGSDSGIKLLIGPGPMTSKMVGKV